MPVRLTAELTWTMCVTRFLAGAGVADTLAVVTDAIPAGADVRARLAEWAYDIDRITALFPDDVRSHGEACWDVLKPTGLLGQGCSDCTHKHYGPHSSTDMNARLHERLTVATTPLWIAATLYFQGYDPGWKDKASALAEDLVELLGPEAEWRTNGDYWVSRPGGPRPLPPPAAREGLRLTAGGTWRPVSEMTFDAAVVGRGAGLCAVIVATDPGG